MGEIERTESWVGKDKVLVQTAVANIRTEYYIVDLKVDKVIKHPGVLWNHGLLGRTVALDTVIYAIGRISDDPWKHKHMIPKGVEYINPDVEHIHSGTSVLKLTESGSNWKDFRKMNCERCLPDCVTLGNKIYAFGGSQRGTPIAEVYDTNKIGGKWEVLTPPTDDDRDWDLNVWRTFTTPIISDPKNNRLLVHFGIVESLYAYYPDNNNKWECLDRNIRCFDAPAEVVDNVIYFFIPSGRYGFIKAYDIPTNKWLKVSWSSSFSDLHHPSIYYSSSMKHMLHLGNGMLCLADSYPLFEGTKKLNTTFLQFVRFRVERIDPGQVRVTPTSVHSLRVEAPCVAACFVTL